MSYLIVDVEATCWEPGSSYRRDQMEIIEIGAVRLDAGFEVVAEFESFVQPVVHRQLSPFCSELTSITQENLESADFFAQVFWRFIDWIGEPTPKLCSWGFYDVGQFRTDCERAGLEFPSWFESDHINLKSEFAAWFGVRRCGMAKALEHLGIALEGTHHRGIDDSRNIARIAQRMLPELEQSVPRR